MATGLSKTKWKNELTFNHFISSIEKNDAGVELSYEGKKQESEIINTIPPKISLIWEGVRKYNLDHNNRLYYGDNLKILAHLLKDCSVCGKVKLVYIDPPFATNSVYQSRSQVDAYCDLLQGAHYIEFIRERLILLRELLSDEGSIYVHLDENMAFYIKIIMDEVFGKKNFRSWITRKKCNPKNCTKKAYGNISDFILFYTKTDKYVWNTPVEDWTVAQAKKEYTYIDDKTGRWYKKVPIHAPGERNGETGKTWKGIKPPPGKHWQFTPKKLDEMDERGEIYWSSNGNPRRKLYFDESKGLLVQNIWSNFVDTLNQNTKVTGYPTEKNTELLNRIIKTSSNPDDLVLDCFCGSGTTLCGAAELKRQWVGIDNSYEAIKTTLKRLLKGSSPMGDFVKKQKNLNRSETAQKTFFNSEENKLINHSKPCKNIIEDFSLYDGTENFSFELESAIKNLLIHKNR